MRLGEAINMEGTVAAYKRGRDEEDWRGRENGIAPERGCYNIQVTKCSVSEMGLGGTRKMSVRAPCCCS